MGQFVFLNENNVARMSSDCKATLLIQVNLHLLNYITDHERITVLACGDMLLLLTVKKKMTYYHFILSSWIFLICKKHGEMCFYMYYI